MGNVFTNGPSGKVNRGLVDSDGNCAVIFMPPNMSRIHKINGANGQLIWTKSISNTVGFGITEIHDSNRVDYIISEDQAHHKKDGSHALMVMMGQLY